MANYKGRLDLTRPYKAVEAVLYNSSDTHVETAVTDNYGFYYFDNIPTGSYTVKFFGRNYRTPADDHLITVVDVFDSESLAPLTFHDPPALGVGEGNPVASIVGERSEAIITLSYLQEKTGILGFVDIFYTLAGISSEWLPLGSINLSEASAGYDSANGIWSGRMSIELLTKPVNYSFKSVFFNPNGEPALVNDLALEAGEADITFNGINDLSEYVGVEGLETLNTNFNGDAVPTNEVVLSWDNMRNKTGGDFINAAGATEAVSTSQLMTISNYVIYMYISTAGSAPSNNDYFPNKTETNGRWYLLDTVPPSVNMTTVRVPQNKVIALWVGFMTGGSTSTTQSTYNF